MKTEIMYFFYLDELREENRMSIDDFIDDICSRRQYWRYRSGENVCPPNRLSEFISRVGLTYSEFFNYFYTKELVEFKKVEVLYGFIQEKNFKEAKEVLSSLDGFHFSSFETRSFYDLCRVLYSNTSVKLADSERIMNYSKFIDYPNILNKSYYTFRDIVILIEIAEYESSQQKDLALNRLYEIVKDEITYVSGNTRFYMPTLYVVISRIFGSKGEIKKSLEISEEGIKYSKRMQDSRALPNLYHLSALSKYKLGYIDYEKDISNCLFSAKSMHKVQVYDTFIKLIQKAFKLSLDEIKKVIIENT